MEKTVTDPVCGMQIEPSKAPAQTIYQGQTYYFCSQDCKREFDEDPQKYSQKAEQPHHWQ